MTDQPTDKPKILEPEELKRRVDNLVELIREKGCGELAKAAAIHLVDRREGGSARNVYNILPQFFEVGRPKQALDFDKNNQVEIHEMTAALLAAASVVADSKKNGHAGIAFADVKIDDALLNEANKQCKELQQNSNACSVTGTGTSQKPRLR